MRDDIEKVINRLSENPDFVQFQEHLLTIREQLISELVGSEEGRIRELSGMITAYHDIAYIGKE